MYANFPGFLYIKSLAKQLTNQFRVPPGGGMPIDAGGQDIRSAVMPLPYKDPSAVFIQLIDSISQQAKSVGGTAELQIGEGTQNAPVGTTLALIEQATRLMAAVHKRLHQAQGQELDMLKSLLMEDPEALWRHNKKSKVLRLLTEMAGQGTVLGQIEAGENERRALFLAALSNADLVPASDPNTSSQTERYMKVVAARQMAQTNQRIDMNKVDEKAFTVMGWDNPEQYFLPAPPPGSGQPSPEDLTAHATILAAQARIADSQTRAREAEVKAQTGTAELASKEKIASLQVARELVIHRADQEKATRDAGVAGVEAQTDRMHKLALANIAGRQARAQQAGDMQEAEAARAHEASQGALDRAHAANLQGMDAAHAAGGAVADRRHQYFSDVLDREHEARQSELDRDHEARMRPSDGVVSRSMGGRVEAPPRHEVSLDNLVEALRGIRAMREPVDPVINDLKASVDRLAAIQLAPRIIVRDPSGRPIGARIDLPPDEDTSKVTIRGEDVEVEV
jgi:hypothetical protein